MQEKSIHLWLRKLAVGICYPTWSKCLCLPMEPAMLPCCPHAFTVPLSVTSQPPWTRTEATWDMLLTCSQLWCLYSCTKMHQSENQGEKYRCTWVMLIRDVSALLPGLSPLSPLRGGKFCTPYGGSFSVSFFFPLLFFSVLFPQLLILASTPTALGFLLKCTVIYWA